MLRDPLFFAVKGRRFQAQRLSAADEFACVRRLSPCVAGFGALVGALAGFAGRGRPGGRIGALADAIGLFAPVGDALSGLTDADIDFVLGHCLGATMVLDETDAWSPLWDRAAQGPRDHGLGLVDAVRVCHVILGEALAAFYAPRRLDYRRTNPSGASYEPVRLPDDLDWLYAPVHSDPPLIPFGHLFDGTVGLAHVVRANEALETRGENVRRAHAAEKARREAERPRR